MGTSFRKGVYIVVCIPKFQCWVLISRWCMISYYLINQGKLLKRGSLDLCCFPVTLCLTWQYSLSRLLWTFTSPLKDERKVTEEYNLHILLKVNFKAQFLLPSCWSLINGEEDHFDDRGAVRGWHSKSKKNCTKKYEMEKIIKNTIERVIAKEKVMEWEILWRDDRVIWSRS